MEVSSGTTMEDGSFSIANGLGQTVIDSHEVRMKQRNSKLHSSLRSPQAPSSENSMSTMDTLQSFSDLCSEVRDTSPRNPNHSKLSQLVHGVPSPKPDVSHITATKNHSSPMSSSQLGSRIPGQFGSSPAHKLQEVFQHEGVRLDTIDSITSLVHSLED